MKWITSIALALVVLVATGWIFRAELVLFGVAQMKSAVIEIGPTIEIEWSTGADSQGRAPLNRPPNIVLIVADDMGWNDISMNGPNTQAEPSWPWATANAHNVDRDLSQDDQPEDEFAYSSN